jgi:hypothetical protein
VWGSVSGGTGPPNADRARDGKSTTIPLNLIAARLRDHASALNHKGRDVSLCLPAPTARPHDPTRRAGVAVDPASRGGYYVSMCAPRPSSESALGGMARHHRGARKELLGEFGRLPQLDLLAAFSVAN